MQGVLPAVGDPGLDALSEGIDTLSASVHHGAQTLKDLEHRIEATVTAGTTHVHAVHDAITARADTAHGSAQALVTALDALSSHLEDLGARATKEIQGLGELAQQVASETEHFLGTFQQSLIAALHALDEFDAAFNRSCDASEAAFAQWAGHVPEATTAISASRSKLQDIISELVHDTDTGYQALTQHAAAFSQTVQQDLSSYVGHSQTDADALVNAVNGQLSDTMHQLDSVAGTVDDSLGEASSRIADGVQAVEEHTGKALDLVTKVMDVIRAIKPVVDTVAHVA